LIDPADFYTAGESETMPGILRAEADVRDRMVPITQCTTASTRATRTPLGAAGT
jgi:aryl-alcohol dehydrogenase-like predicted oxidoreductase